jgi:AcrR family transcriptional regulator
VQISSPGRPREADLDERILEATRRLLAEVGYPRLSIGAVAQAAGTSRPSVYLRFANKEDLVTAAIAGMRIADLLQVTDDIRADLVAELRHFRTAVTRPQGLSLVGTVLAEEHCTPALIAHFRKRLILPRRRRLASLLERGIATGNIRRDLDVEAAVTMLVGSLYARYLASSQVPDDWPERVVETLWPALRASSGP